MFKKDEKEEKFYLELIESIRIFMNKNRDIRSDSLERLWDISAEISEKYEEAKNAKEILYLQ